MPTGFTLWNYATSDTLAVVKGSGYFNEIAPFARVGDMVLVNADTGGSQPCAGYYFGCLHCRRCRDGQKAFCPQRRLTLGFNQTHPANLRLSGQPGELFCGEYHDLYRHRLMFASLVKNRRRNDFFI